MPIEDNLDKRNEELDEILSNYSNNGRSIRNDTIEKIKKANQKFGENNFDDALRILTNCILSDPKGPALYYNRSVIYKKLGGKKWPSKI